MKKYIIALVGVFDLKNYGDHLYPVVFEKQMQKRGIQLETMLFSNFACDQDFESNRTIYSLDDIETIHKDKHIDAVVLAGGEVIHTRNFPQSLDLESIQKKVDYSMGTIWIRPLLFCKKYGVKCIWNGVGVPFELGDSVFLKYLINAIDYIAVRNQTSANYLQRIGVDSNIHIIPDAAFLMDSVYSVDYLVDIRNKLGLHDKYIVLHCGRFIPESDKVELKKILTRYMDLNYQIVFLPLAYTNGDQISLSMLANELEIDVVMFSKVLHVEEIVAVLAGAEQYIGLSFHGTITSVVYGKNAVNYDYNDQIKTTDLCNYIGCNEMKCINLDDLDKSIHAVALKADAIRHRLDEIKDELECHFDRVASEIQTERVNVEKGKEFPIKDVEDVLIKANNESLYVNQIEDLEKHWNECANDMREQGKELQSWQRIAHDQGLQLAERENLRATIRDYENDIINKKSAIRYEKQKNDELKDAINELKDHLKQKDEELFYLKQERDLLNEYRHEVETSKTMKILRTIDRIRGIK